MMLIKDFYKIKTFSVSENSTAAVIVLNPQHSVYQGHFPQQPVVPGVIQLQIIRELAEQSVTEKLFINEVVSAKYLNMIIPDNNPLEIELVIKPDGEIYKVTAVIKNNERIFSKVKMRLSIV